MRGAAAALQQRGGLPATKAAQHYQLLRALLRQGGLP
jgi:hypothetical protein